MFMQWATGTALQGIKKTLISGALRQKM